VRRIALTIPEDALEAVLDRLLPLIPQGVHWTALDGGALELAVYDTSGDLPSLESLAAAAGPDLRDAAEEEAPDDPDERRVRYRRRAPLAGRLAIRPSDAPPAGEGLIDVVIDSPDGAFGAGTHPTTSMSLELLLELEPGGSFADLGCGAGVLSIVAAKLGWGPVIALDHEPNAVEVTLENAARNGVEVDAIMADLLQILPPPVRTIAANVPIAVHAHVAAALPPEVEQVIVSGIVDHHLADVVGAYEQAGLGLREERGSSWMALLMVRGG
jgi:ribosomal protein L11 methyltransferase